MSKIKVATIVGARPQFIKAAVVSRAIASHNDNVADKSAQISEIIIHTGQHYDRNMSDVFFEEMQIPRPNYFLDIHEQSHAAMTGRMLEKIEEVLIKEKPDVVLVYGDTNTTLAGALAAAKLHLKVAHVEAGLRSFNRQMPEEINRILTDHISDILFCPTQQSVQNLTVEGICQESLEKADRPHSKSATFSPLVQLIGDVMFDAALYYKEYARKPQIDLPDRFALSTIHRAENTDDPARLKSIFSGFHQISKTIPIILPLHPRTKKTIKTQNIDIIDSNVQIIDPVSYLEIIYLLEKCAVVMTDSGGLQKEAFFFQKPCITLRDETEWVELIDNGVNELAGADSQKICDLCKEALKKEMDFGLDLYGKGDAGEKIVEAIAKLYF
jgi:UDP-GlcNAc3NAcA epimerase